jgi:hypothetical protein
MNDYYTNTIMLVFMHMTLMIVWWCKRDVL